MIKAIIFDFSGVILFAKDVTYAASHNKLHDELVKKNEYMIFDYFRLNEELLNFLTQLKEKYKLYIFSTGHIQDYPEVKQKLELVFAKTYSVDEIGFPKNNHKSFLEISKQIDLEPNEVLFIDDTLENINSAKQANLTTIHFSSNEDLFKSLESMNIL